MCRSEAKGRHDGHISSVINNKYFLLGSLEFDNGSLN